nr:MAG: capsid protein [Cressdnaviricota sp.]
MSKRLISDVLGAYFPNTKKAPQNSTSMSSNYHRNYIPNGPPQSSWAGKRTNTSMYSSNYAMRRGRKNMRSRMFTKRKQILRGWINPSRGVELKYIDNSVGFSQVSGVPAIGLLNAAIQGTTANTRTGQEILIKSVQWRIYLKAGTTTFSSGLYPLVRILLVLDRQPNGAAFGSTDLFEWSGGATTISTALQATCSPIALKNRKRFIILKDVTSEMDQGHGNCYFHQFYRKVRIKTEYNSGNAGTIGDINTNALFIVIQTSVPSGSNTGSDDIPYWGGFIRLRFEDS